MTDEQLERYFQALHTDIRTLDEFTRRELAAVREEMATKADIAAVRKEMATEFASVRKEMATKADLATVRKEMATGFAAVRKEMATELSEFRTEVRENFRSLNERLAAVEEK